jgi:hypothetical protein
MYFYPREATKPTISMVIYSNKIKAKNLQDQLALQLFTMAKELVP